ncbi:conserved Plasmodium protein, unknown function [Plasmodium gonderi]|uniref:Leucine-rich repeat protein n=1 Tax=Plasmodium gonderi TaxID=77519 RepID=A0A1Y1JC57_PLAGO|nr:conserved Plasmodium protein, unknown function [Plasmodium gonderi]GAW80076.1 conserved Plasmodium protein, unknown function [Plasmodium gonderi]
MESKKSSKSNESYKNLVDCYYLLLKKFKRKSSYVIDEFLIKENKESNGNLTIYEDVNSEAFCFLILSMIDSNYDCINKINILNVQNGNDLIKAICFYMDNVKISELLKKNTKNVRKKNVDTEKKNKMNLKKKKAQLQKEPEEEPSDEVVIKNMCNIKSMSIFNSNIDINGITLLSKSLYDNGYPKLENLSIDCIDLNCHCLKYLSLSLCNYNNLKTLSFQYCNLSNDCIKYIIDIIIYLNSSLSTLNLSGNKFNDEGIFLLNNSLNNVDVSYNMFNLSDSFVQTFCKIIASQTNISSISLIGNFLENANLSKINDAMNFNKSISILKLPHE